MTKCFLIDDDHVSLFLTEQVLRTAGLTELICFLSAAAAYEQLREGVPDDLPGFIFLDLNMPFMDGWEFLEALTPFQEQLRDRCKIYVLTSSLDQRDLLRSREYNLVSGFIHKPLDHEDVLLILSRQEE